MKPILDQLAATVAGAVTPEHVARMMDQMLRTATRNMTRAARAAFTRALVDLWVPTLLVGLPEREKVRVVSAMLAASARAMD